MFLMTQREIFDNNLLFLTLLFILFIIAKIKESRSMFYINFSEIFSVYIVPCLVFIVNIPMYFVNRELISLLFMSLILIPIINTIIDFKEVSTNKKFIEKHISVIINEILEFYPNLPYEDIIITVDAINKYIKINVYTNEFSYNFQTSSELKNNIKNKINCEIDFVINKKGVDKK